VAQNLISVARGTCNTRDVVGGTMRKWSLLWEDMISESRTVACPPPTVVDDALVSAGSPAATVLARGRLGAPPRGEDSESVVPSLSAASPSGLVAAVEHDEPSEVVTRNDDCLLSGLKAAADTTVAGARPPGALAGGGE
jgi:hypothetical protein